jgi:ribonuclease-3
MSSHREDANTEALEAALGHAFQNRNLLSAALTHPSLEEIKSYQRLEFFGDRVLGLVIAEALYEAFPEADEGELSRRLNAHVRKEALAEVAAELDLGPLIRMAGATEETGGRENKTILADVMEAIIGALYLDGGLEAARRAIHSRWSERLRTGAPEKDAKTRLQEWLQGRGEAAPHYAITDRQGPDHAPQFTVRAEAKGMGSAEAQGTNRQAAEFAAAEELLKFLQSEREEE